MRLHGAEIRAGHLIAWCALSVLAVLSAPIQLRLRQPFWALLPADGLQAWVWAAAFLGVALFLNTLARRPGGVGAGWVLLAGIACWGSAYASLALRPNIAFSQWVAVLSAGIGSGLAVLPFYLRRLQMVGTSLLGIAVAVVVLIGFRSAPPRLDSTPATVRMQKSQHAITLTTYSQIVDSAELEGGAIEALGDGYLLVTGEGEFYRLGWHSGGVALRSHRVPMTAPLDRETYLNESKSSSRIYLLRVTDLALDTSTAPPTVFVAHQHWNSERRCFTMRVSAAPFSDGGSRDQPPAAWRTVYQTEPCLQPSEDFEDVETGGRLAWHGGRSLLFTVGDHGLSGVSGGPSLAQDAQADYGKILKLNLSGGHEVFSMGHRNPQGLVVDRENRIWSTEHGPEGGDEINVITRDGNYGWPLATYGTQYGFDFWPLSIGQRDHGRFVEPVHVFLPAIGTSNLIQLNRDQFPAWKGDFLVASLRGMTVFRIRTRGSQILYLEPILVGRRLRDIAEGRDGRVLLWTGERDIVVLSRAEPTVGERVYQLCSGCHGPDMAGTALGPQLRRFFGRDVAAGAGFPFSPALRRLGGQWTEERLDAFLRDPEGYAPGTSMKVKGIRDGEVRRALIAYLRHPVVARN